MKKRGDGGLKYTRVPVRRARVHGNKIVPNALSSNLGWQNKNTGRNLTRKSFPIHYNLQSDWYSLKNILAVGISTTVETLTEAVRIFL